MLISTALRYAALNGIVICPVFGRMLPSTGKDTSGFGLEALKTFVHLSPRVFPCMSLNAPSTVSSIVVASHGS